MAATNDFGFPVATGFETPTIQQQGGISIGAGLQLPAIAEGRLTELLALRLLSLGAYREALSDARGAVQAFERKVFEAYRTTWEELKETGDFRALRAERASIERDLAAAQRAEALYMADTPISRGSLQVLASLAAESARFVNRNRGLKAAEPVSLKKSDTPEVLQSALEEAEQSLDALERAWPVKEIAWASILRQLDGLAKLPSVAIHERLQPDNHPRPLPAQILTSLIIPEVSSLHPTSPGSSLRLNLPDATGMLFALMRPQIEELLKAKLEALYDTAEARGITVLPEKERRASVKAAKSAKLELERRLCELYWTGKAPATILNSEISPAAVLGVEA